MPLSGHSAGTYPETSSHATRQGTLSHSRLSSLSHCELILKILKCAPAHLHFQKKKKKRRRAMNRRTFSQILASEERATITTTTTTTTTMPVMLSRCSRYQMDLKNQNSSLGALYILSLKHVSEHCQRLAGSYSGEVHKAGAALTDRSLVWTRSVLFRSLQ